MSYSDLMLKSWAEEQRLRVPTMKNAPAFYRNLEQVLDTRRQGNYMMGLKPRWDDRVVDYTTCDFLSLSRSGRIREAFLKELQDHPDFDLSAAGSRIQYGNYDYLNMVEKEIADFHGAEAVYLTNSGFHANQALLSGVPQPGDAIVYDELVHASTHEGMHLSFAEHKMPFRHNDPDALRDVLIDLKTTQPAFAAGTRSIIICVETIYSMDGDICALKEFMQIAKEEFPLGNAQFLVDEAHSIGVIGDKGRGLCNLLGVEKDIAMRVHVASKALGSVGGMILCNNTIRYMLLNQARSVTFSCAPSFPAVAAVRCGYKFLMNGETREEQETIQRNVRYFFKSLQENSTWEEASDEGLLSIPLLEDWEQRPFQTHIIPLRTRNRHEQFLFFQLLLNNMNAYPMAFPVVPKGQTRVRLVFHAHNTFEQIDRLVNVICSFAREMLDIEAGEAESMLPIAARQIYAMQAAAVQG
ncbi:MAG: putative secondary metabolism biosynthetic enzyme [Bathelium mastoideum]|nr:MAG: putative secondary metabolism biosynthetic enzyme [Bathelium mastoideum]